MLDESFDGGYVAGFFDGMLRARELLRDHLRAHPEHEQVISDLLHAGDWTMLDRLLSGESPVAVRIEVE